jgi:methane/ammonia monooxygenase subunit B
MTTVARRLRPLLLIAIGLLLASAIPADAHGERAQEAFLKMRTIGWVGVGYEGGETREGESGDDEIFIEQGETVTVTGTATLMEQWPNTLAGGDPRTGFINIIAPGPVITIREKSINGVSAPHRIEIEKGGIYEFDMTLAGRTVGRWHVHPAFSVKGAGTLLGPGAWVNVTENADYTNEVALVDGGTINLENYELPFVWIYSTITFVLGMGWMFYWTLRKRTVQNLAVTSQIPLNTDGMNVGLITKADHRNMNWFLVAALVVTIGGFVYQIIVWPDKIPQQVIEFAPPPAEVPEVAEAVGISSAWEASSGTVTLTFEVTNTSEGDLEVAEFTTSTLRFVNPDVAEATGEAAEMTVEPSGSIGEGDTEEVTLTLQDDRWASDQLIPSAESQLEISGLVVLEGADESGFAEVHAPLRIGT